MFDVSSLTGIAVEVALVLIFINYSLKTQERYMASMDTRDKSYLDILNSLKNAVNCLKEEVQSRKCMAVDMELDKKLKRK
jgi:hypothetical protein